MCEIKRIIISRVVSAMSAFRQVIVKQGLPVVQVHEALREALFF
jgi:hypothetical protein